ncbi:MAG: hypothetical protein H0V01_09930 [Bacteroidetes bacterium]|nr:hypothetical protein [Bacteroidota bacterium]HET6246018.1 hypothetical protein [Bacteroidia bacterium]
MNKFLPLVFALCALILFGFTMKGPSATSKFKEIIIGIEDAHTSRDAINIKKELNLIPGVQYIGYCNILKCIMVKINLELIQDEKLVLEKVLDMGYKEVHVKEGITVFEIKKVCKDKIEIEHASE